MRCLKDKRLQTYIDGELAAPEAADLKHHLDACPACRDRLAELRTASERVKAGISSLDPARIPAPPPLRPEATQRPARRSAPWRRFVTSSIGVPAAAVAMAGLFVLGVALGTFLKGRPGAQERPRSELRAGGTAGAPLQGLVRVEVSSLSLNLEDYSPIAQPNVFMIKE